MSHHHELHRRVSQGPESRAGDRRDQKDARGASRLNALPGCEATGPASAPAPDPEGGRLLWHCRRGMKELDIILERFVRARLPLASRAERGLLAELLALPDPELAHYLL